MTLNFFIVLIIGLLGLILIVSNPYIGLLVFTAFLYLRPSDFFPALGPLHVTRLIAALTFVVMALRKGENKEYFFKNTPQTRILTALIAVMLLSVTTSIWRSNTMDYFFNFLKVYLGYLLIINLVRSVKQFKGVIWIMVSSGLFIGISSIMNCFKYGHLSTDYRAVGIMHGMFGNSNDLALCLIILIPFAYFFLRNSKSIFMKIFSVFCLVIFFMGIILTYSRGGFLGLAGLILVFFLKKKNKVVAIVGLSTMILLFFLFVPSEYKERMRTISTSYVSDGNAITRIDAWRAGVSMMTHRLFGVGLGNFGEGFFRYRPANAIDIWGKRRAAHNAFIQIGGETGIIGMIIFICLIVVTFKSLQRTKNSLIRLSKQKAKEIVLMADVVFLSLVGFVVTVLFLSQAYNWILYFLIGFSVILEEFVKTKYYEQQS